MNICDASTGSTVTQIKKDKAKTSLAEYRGAFGPAIGDDLIHGNMPESSSLIKKGVIIAIILLFVLITPCLTLCYCCYCCCDKSKIKIFLFLLLIRIFVIRMSLLLS